MFLSSHFIFWVKYRVIPPSYHKTARQLSPRTLNLSSLSFSSFLQRDPSFCPSRWYQRQAFHSVEGDSENTQDMTVTDESLSARCLNQGQSAFCALSRLAYKRTTPDTHTHKTISASAASEAKRETIKFAVTRLLSQPCSAATSNCGENCESSLYTLTNLTCQVRAKHRTQATLRRCAKSTAVNKQLREIICKLTTECIFIDQCVRFNVCHCCSWTICVMSCNSYGSIRSEEPQRTSSDRGSPLQKQMFPKV